MKFIIAHPGQQHSFRTATALKRAGLLQKYLTTVYVRKGTWTLRILPFLSGLTLTKAKRRRCDALEDNDVIQYYELPALITILLSHFSWLSNLKNRWSMYVTKSFNKKVISYALKNNVEGIIVYDGTVKRNLDVLSEKSPNTISIMDVSSATRPWMREVYTQDMNKYNYNDIYNEEPDLWNEQVICDVKSDLRNCQFFLVASSVVKESLIFCGVKPEQIKILPYGVDANKFIPIKHINNAKLTLIFVGRICKRKGIHHLLYCARELRDKIDIILVGGIDSASDLYKEYNNDSNISFVGFVDSNRLKEYYARADVFVLPSLSEGMSLAGLEAMSFGMPILCSDHSGINDLIEDGINGYVFQTGNLEDLKNKICWFIENKNKCASMGKCSREIALEHTWERYYDDFAKIINEIIKR